MPAIVFGVILLVAGLSNLVGGNFALGLCRLFGVVLSGTAYFLIGPAYTQAMREGRLSPLVILVYAPLAIGEVTGRVISERALQRSGMRMRSLGADPSHEDKA